MIAADGTSGPWDFSHAWRFDAFERLEQAVLPGGADPTLRFAYNDRDDVMGITRANTAPADYLETAYEWFDQGPVNTITVTDPLPSSAPRLLLDYGTPDATLNVTSQSESRDGATAQTTSYLYDDADRLSEANYPMAFGLPEPDAFEYDLAGNRDDADNPGSFTYNVNNQITVSPGRAYIFDKDGNLETITDGGTPTPTTLVELGWDFGNRLQTYDDLDAGRTATYLYDTFGRRIFKEVDDGTTTIVFYLWDGDQLLAEYDASGGRIARYAYAEGFAPIQVAYPGGQCNDGIDNDGDGDTDFAGGDTGCASVDGPLEGPGPSTDQCSDTLDNDGDGLTDSADPDCASDSDTTEAPQERLYDVHADHLDTPRVLTDVSGAAVWRASYEAYGNAKLDPANTVSSFNIRFPGQYYDVESALHDNRFRTYDPSVGRYISADPIGQFGLVGRAADPSSLLYGADANVYSYAFASPVNLIDPSGLIIAPIVTAVMTPIVGAASAQAQGLAASVVIGSLVSAAQQTGTVPNPPPSVNAALAATSVYGSTAARALGQAVALTATQTAGTTSAIGVLTSGSAYAVGTATGALLVSFAGGFSLGTASNTLLAMLGLDAHLTYYGDKLAARLLADCP